MRTRQIRICQDRSQAELLTVVVSGTSRRNVLGATALAKVAVASPLRVWDGHGPLTRHDCRSNSGMPPDGALRQRRRAVLLNTRAEPRGGGGYLGTPVETSASLSNLRYELLLIPNSLKPLPAGSTFTLTSRGMVFAIVYATGS